MQRFMANFTESDNRVTKGKVREWPINYIAEVPARDFEDARKKLFDAVKESNPGAYPFLRSAILKKEDYKEYQDYTREDARLLRKAGVEFG